MNRKDETRPALPVRLLRFAVGLSFGVLIPAAILAAGAYGAYYLMKTAPQAERTTGARGESTARLVEAVQLPAERQQIVVEAMGLVTPSRSVSLQPRVDGEIVAIHPNLEQGGFIAKGETVVEIDRADYELAVQQAKAQVAQMESALAIEMGQQEVAREEYALLGENIPESDAHLVLRKPQLEAAKADLDRARASLREAELDLERTAVKSPFNSLVQEENAEVGAIASRNQTIARLVGTDRFWVELSVPVDSLRWIVLPGPEGQGGSMVRIRDTAAWRGEAYREGHVIRFAASVDERSRMATLLVGVDDPLALHADDNIPRMLLGSYVSAGIQGKSVGHAVAVPRQHIREDDTVWVMNESQRLEIRKVDVLWRGKSEVIVADGLADGEWIVTSSLSAPVDGMKLRINDSTVSGSETGPETESVAQTEPTPMEASPAE